MTGYIPNYEDALLVVKGYLYRVSDVTLIRLSSGCSATAFYWKRLVWRVEPRKSTRLITGYVLSVRTWISMLWNDYLRDHPTKGFLASHDFIVEFDSSYYYVSVKPWVITLTSVMSSEEADKLARSLEQELNQYLPILRTLMEPTRSLYQDFGGQLNLYWDSHRYNVGYNDDFELVLFDF